jgi:hypothetical protein
MSFGGLMEPRSKYPISMALSGLVKSMMLMPP